MFDRICYGIVMLVSCLVGVVIEALPTTIAFLIAYFFLKWLEMF